MLNYTNFFEKPPVVILNIPGKVIIDNKENNSLILEVDYNGFPEDILKKIKNGNEEIFNEVTECVTYDADKIKQRYMPVLVNNNGTKYLHNILSENNSINFSMIKNKIEIIKANKLIKVIDSTYSKKISFSLSDGDYIFRINTFNVNDELVFKNDILVILKTNYYSLNSNKGKEIKIPFNKYEGNFNLVLMANPKRLYSFKIVDIVSENDNIFDFSYYNTAYNDVNIIGKIGSEINLINDKQAEEIIKNPQQEQLIKPTFVFDIKEVFTTQHSKDDIGVIRFPTIKEKIRDTYMPYYDLKCDVSQSYSVDFEKTNDLLVTDKFNKYPLFYKFIIDEPYDDFKIKDEDGNYIEDYIMETINKNLKLIYFNPLRNKKYYYSLYDNFYYNIEYKKAIDSYKMTFYTGKVELDKPQYISDLILYGPEGTYDVEIQFSDYNRKTFKIKSINREFNYLEDERVKINKEIITMKVLTDKNIGDFKFINVLCNFKNNRNSYSFFKKDNRDFVYIAKEVGNIKIEDIPNSQLSKLNINKKYILKDGILEEVNNGPIYLEAIKKQDIVFTDIEEWVNEYDIAETLTMKTHGIDDFFKENVVDNSMEIVDEIK